MDLSLFLARILGPLYLIVTIGLFLNHKYFSKMIKEVIKSPSCTYFYAAFDLLIGLILVNTHNLWVNDWRLVITIMAWMVLIKGALLLVFPEQMTKSLKKWRKQNWYLFGVILSGILGIYLTYAGYLS